MANIPRYTDDELSSKWMEDDFDLKKVFDMQQLNSSFSSPFTSINAGILLYLNTQVFVLIITKKPMLFRLTYLSKSRL